jgi:hypothetical protein
MNYETILKGVDKIGERLDSMTAEQNVLAERLAGLEQKGHVSRDGGQKVEVKSIGADFADQLTKHRETFDRTRSISLQVETKGLITAPLVGARTSMGATPGSDVNLAELAAVLQPVRMAGNQALIYARRGGATEGFASKPQNGEGAAKQEVTPNYTSVTQAQITVAGYVNVSEQALGSDAELRSAIDLFLTADLLSGASTVLTSGSTATGATFEGFVSLAGVLNAPSDITNNLEATIGYAALQMRATGYNPTVCVVNVLGWAGAALRAGADGHWVNGSPFVMPQMTIAGMRVAFSSAVPVGKALLIDERYAGWGLSSTMRIDANYVNDGFIKNIVTLRGEMGLIPFVRDIFAVRLAQRLP